MLDVYILIHTHILEQNVQDTSENAHGRRKDTHTNNCDRRWKAKCPGGGAFVMGIERKKEQAVICCWGTGKFLEEALFGMGPREASGDVEEQLRCSTGVKVWRQESSLVWRLRWVYGVGSVSGETRLKRESAEVGTYDYDLLCEQECVCEGS